MGGGGGGGGLSRPCTRALAQIENLFRSKQLFETISFMSCFIIVHIGMTFISCGRLSHFLSSSALSVTTPRATPQIFYNTCRLSAAPADFPQHSGDFLQYLRIFCNTLLIFCNTCGFFAIRADFLQRLQIFCNTLQIFCNTYKFSVTLCRFSVIPADFLQHLRIFCNTCRFSAVPANFLQHSADFSQPSADFLRRQLRRY